MKRFMDVKYGTEIELAIRPWTNTGKSHAKNKRTILPVLLIAGKTFNEKEANCLPNKEEIEHAFATEKRVSTKKIKTKVIRPSPSKKPGSPEGAKSTI